MRAPVPLDKAYRLINHGPVVLVSSAHGGTENVMTAAWCMALDFAPPKLAVVVAADTFTRRLIEQSGELVVQVPTKKMLAVVDGAGNCSGKDTDKWTELGIERERAGKVKAPLVAGCSAWLECKIVDGDEERVVQERYDLFVCEVIAAWADDAVFRGGHFVQPIPEDKRALHHVAGGQYIVDGPQVRAS